MLIHRLKVAGFLSFGPRGIDLSLEPLNVLIGPNGSGKSNFLKILALLHYAPRGVSGPVSHMSGVGEWLWKGPEAPVSIAIEALINYPQGGFLRHKLVLADRNGRPSVIDEQVEPSQTHADERAALSYYRPPKDEQAALEISRANAKTAHSASGPRTFARRRPGAVDFASELPPEQSLLSYAATPDYPALWYLKEQYRQIRIYRDWSFGPSAEFRKNQSSHDRADFLDDGGTNLALVLSHFQGRDKRRFLAALRKLFDGIVDIACPVTGGTVTLYLEEDDNRTIPATRLSDGTLRYLCLLAILLHPDPPPLVAIEEPELGLHPDLLPTLGDLLLEASERSQLIVTTHSDVLVDALTDSPESIVVCEKHGGQTEMRRLDKDELAKWLEEYRLGDLWTSGELGGNRW